MFLASDRLKQLGIFNMAETFTNSSPSLTGLEKNPETMLVKQEKKSEITATDIKTGDNEDSESMEEQPLDIGEHYLVRRSDQSWREFFILEFGLASRLPINHAPNFHLFNQYQVKNILIHNKY